MFKPKVIFQGHSQFSGPIKVIETLDYRYISSGYLTQSGGLIFDVWKPILKKIARKKSSWLILGLAAGSVAQIISRQYAPSQLVGVEIDPLMVELGVKYLKLDRIKHLEIVVRDAQDYLRHLDTHFDYILVDMYLGDQLPQFVYTKEFLLQLKAHGGTVVLNHLFYDQANKSNAEMLVASLKKTFPSVTLHRVLTNLIIVCSA